MLFPGYGCLIQELPSRTTWICAVLLRVAAGCYHVYYNWYMVPAFIKSCFSAPSREEVDSFDCSLVASWLQDPCSTSSFCRFVLAGGYNQCSAAVPWYQQTGLLNGFTVDCTFSKNISRSKVQYSVFNGILMWPEVAVLLLLGMTVLHWLCKHCWPADASALSDAYNQKLQTLMERSLPAQAGKWDVSGSISANAVSLAVHY